MEITSADDGLGRVLRYKRSLHCPIGRQGGIRLPRSQGNPILYHPWWIGKHPRLPIWQGGGHHHVHPPGVDGQRSTEFGDGGRKAKRRRHTTPSSSTLGPAPLPMLPRSRTRRARFPLRPSQPMSRRSSGSAAGRAGTLSRAPLSWTGRTGILSAPSAGPW